MSRSLLSFLLFLAILAGGFAVVGWWVGPAMISLALDDERRSTPYYLIHLLDREAAPGYFQTFNQLLREEQGQLLWRGGLTALHAGRSRDEFGSAAFVEFAEGGAVVQMMTSSAYREITAQIEPVLLGTEIAPGPIARDETLVLWLLETTRTATPEALASMSHSAREFGGQLIWSVPVAVLEGERSWNYLLLLAFPDPSAVQTWLTNPETATDRTLARRLYVEEAIMELSAN